jgi:hypothetical protein
MAKNDDREIVRSIRMPAERQGNRLRKGRLITDPDELAASGLDLKELQERGDIAGNWGRSVAKKPAAKEEADEAEDADDLSDLDYTELRARAKEAGVKGYGKMKKAELAAALEGEAASETEAE